MTRPLATLSLDLDNQWSYMKTHGDEGWESLPSYLPSVVPRILEILEQLGQKITVFVVGQDAALENNHAELASICAAGHEIGCHSFHHDPFLHLYSRQQLVEEFELAEAAILKATGIRPTGFRGPGFCLSPTVLEVLASRGYRYDATTLPTFLGPVCRAYYFWKSDLSPEEKEKLKQLYGPMSRGLWPLRPYYWGLEQGQLLELPVTTFPILKLPVHVSYLMYLGCFSASLARLYLRSALRLYRWLGHEPSLLLHPLDFLGADEVPELDFFPGMDQPGEVKRDRLRQYLRDLRQGFDVLPLGEYVDRLEARRGLPTRTAANTT